MLWDSWCFVKTGTLIHILPYTTTEGKIPTNMADFPVFLIILIILFL